MSENSTIEQKHKNVRIGDKTEFFAWLPNCIVYDWGLSADALAAALYLNGKPAGWQARPFDIRAHFKWGERIWLRVSRELKSVDLLREKRIATGGTELWFELPDMNLSISKSRTRQNVEVDKTSRSTKCRALAKKDLSLPKKDLYLTDKDILCENKKNEVGRPAKDKDTEDGLVGEAFDKAWQAYPLKKAKQSAHKAFLKAFDGKAAKERLALLATIVSALAAHINEHRAKCDLKAQGGDIWVSELPHFATWITQRRWEDEYQTPEDILKKTSRKKQTLDLSAIESQWEFN